MGCTSGLFVSGVASKAASTSSPPADDDAALQTQLRQKFPRGTETSVILQGMGELGFLCMKPALDGSLFCTREDSDLVCIRKRQAAFHRNGETFEGVGVTTGLICP